MRGILLLNFFIVIGKACAFLPISVLPSWSSAASTQPIPLFAVSGDDASGSDFPDDEDNDKEPIGKDPGRGSSPQSERDQIFETFLNQCTIQSFLFLLNSLHDRHTVLWVENFTQPIIPDAVVPEYIANLTVVGENDHMKLLTYHGLNALNTTLFPTWDSYFRKLLEMPEELYLIESDSPYVPSYELEIKPASLCSRMTSVRAQIANEFVMDLQVISTLGGHTMESYWDGIRKLRAKDDDGDAEDKTTARIKQSFLFLEFRPDSFDTQPSPIRKGNFDLLMNLVTQQSILRVIDKGNSFLQSFYLERESSFFVGAKRYGQADAFLHELLSVPPRVIQHSEDVTELVDPTRIAEQVLKMREEVALEWKEIASNVPVAHMDIQRLQLNLLMGKPAAGTTSAAEEKH